jgi:uncharacterized protein (TIGR02391 family)
MKIFEHIPDTEVLLGVAVEELAYHLLVVANANLQNGIVHRDSIISVDPIIGQPHPYPPQYEAEISLALLEALNWLEVNGLLIPPRGPNGTNGFRMLGRRGRELLNTAAYAAFQKASAFPKALLHPAIADRVWIELARGDLSDAVFIAFRAVEEALRSAGPYQPTDIGIDLARRAFNITIGPLTDQSQPAPEREALAHLFAGAIGSYKNPHSHRTVTIDDPLEAQEIVMLASHLLRIIDHRRPMVAP